MSWDRTFCDKGDAGKEKCRKCEYYLDREKLRRAGRLAVYLSFYMIPPCEDKPIKIKKVRK